jgi:Glycosyl transferase family 2
MSQETPAGPAAALAVAAVVVGTNEREWLPECLTTPQDSSIPLRVYYVDNASSDESAAYVRQHHPDVVVISNSANLGFAGANNVGIRAAALSCPMPTRTTLPLPARRPAHTGTSSPHASYHPPIRGTAASLGGMRSLAIGS